MDFIQKLFDHQILFNACALTGDNTSMMAAATAFTIIGKMGATAAFSCSFVLTPEMYPTNMRLAI